MGENTLIGKKVVDNKTEDKKNRPLISSCVALIYFTIQENVYFCNMRQTK